MIMANRRASACFLFGILALTACNGEENEGAPSLEQGPAYMLATRVWDDTATTSFFHVVPSLEADTTIDTSLALEAPGSAKLYAVDDIGWFAVGGGEQPTITHYALSPDGMLEERATISLADYGVQSLWDTLYVVSKTKMYYPDRAGGQLIIINPSEMTIDGSVAIPDANRDGYLAVYGYTPLMRDDRLLFSVGWFDWDENDSVLGETGLVLVNTETDTVERVDVDDRCGGITTGVVTESGDAYFVSSAMAGAAHRLGRLTTAPCALRIARGESAFDPDFAMDLGELTGVPVLGEPVPAGGASMFLRVFDEEAAMFTDESLTWELTGQTVWQWWKWDTESGEASRVEEIGASTADVLWFEVEGRLFGTETTADYSHTTLIDLEAEGGPKPALTAPGFLHGVARIR